MATEPVHTIADIARIAGVSKATVSRALNDSPLIGTDTKERIRAIAREHDFRMNAPARRLSLKQSHVVGLMTYEYRKDPSRPDAFLLEMMSGITSGLLENGYDLLVFQAAAEDLEWPRRYLETGRVDGFILLAWNCTQAHLDTLVAQKAPFIAWGLPHGAHPFSTVSGDSFAGGKLATEHLLRTARSKIAFIGGPEKAVEAQDRLRGYEAALREAGLEVDPELVVHGSWQTPEPSGTERMRELLERAPDLDGVFAASDRLAIGALEALRERGRRVPDDVGVVGYDDVALAQHSDPPLTTIRQDGPLAGKLLARHLIEHLQTGVVTNLSIPAELVVREST